LRLAVSQTGSGSFDNFPGFYAAGTDFHTSVPTAGQLDPDRLKVGIKTPSRFIVSVRNVISKLRAFPANLAAFCHNIASRIDREQIKG